MAEQKSFLIYYDTKNIIGALSDSQAGRLLKSLFKFAVSGESTNFSDDGMLKMAFGFMSEHIERDALKYKKKCEKNKQIALERERKRRESKGITVQENESTHTDKQADTPAYENKQENVPSYVKEQENTSSGVKEQKKNTSARIKVRTDIFFHENDIKDIPYYEHIQENIPSYTSEHKPITCHVHFYVYIPYYTDEDMTIPSYFVSNEYDENEDIRSFENEPEYIPPYENEPEYVPPYENEQKYTPSYKNEPEYVSSYENKPEYVSSYGNKHERVQPYTDVYERERLYTNDYNRSQPYTDVNEREQPYTDVYERERLYTNDYDYDNPDYIDDDGYNYELHADYQYYDDVQKEEHKVEPLYMPPPIPIPEAGPGAKMDIDINDKSPTEPPSVADLDYPELDVDYVPPVPRQKPQRNIKKNIHHSFAILFSTATPYEINFFKENFNEICKSFKNVKKVNDADKKNIAEIMMDFTDNEIIRTFKKIEKSTALKGRRGKPQKPQADFSWLITYENFLDIFNGKYDNKPRKSASKTEETSEETPDTPVETPEETSEKT